MVRVKICCISSVAEAELAVRHGAAALRLVGAMPSGPGPIEDALIAEIAKSVPPPVATFLLTSETEPDAILDHVRRCGTNTVQLVDALLLDSGRPAAAVKELGGTGRVHDWSLSRRIVAEVSRPVFLAGGLRPGNAAEAWQAVQPFALDLCTGVRTGGRLDGAKLQAFFGALAL